MYLSLYSVPKETDTIHTIIPFAYSQTLNPVGANTNTFFGTSALTSSLSKVNLVSSSLSQYEIQNQRQQQQQISPWFPTVPAIACSTGLFSFNINGVPEKVANVPIGYDNNNNLLALQVQLNNNNGFTEPSGDEVQGQITVGEKNIEKNNGKDFRVEDTSSTCRTLAYSSSANVKIETPLPSIPLNDDGITQTLPPYCYVYTYYNPLCEIIGLTIPVSIVQDAALKFDQAFQPNLVNVNVGGAIRWTNDDSQIHTVVSGTGPSDPNQGEVF